MTLMCFLLDTGCRVSEALGVTHLDLDFDKHLARVRGRGKKERHVPFGEHTRAWLERYLEQKVAACTTEFVFVNQYGERLSRNAVAQRIADYGKAAGLRGVRTSAHTFRHTFGIQWLMGRGDFKGDTPSLMRILGHTTSAMTDKYAHFVGQDLPKLHEKLSPADGIVALPPTNKRHRIR